jgi:hypothetical protein
MKFFGEGETYLELLLAGTEGDRILLTARLGEGERTTWTKTITTTRGEIAALADWLENFWEPCPAARLGSLRFIYSHREHIGEGYYDITDEATKILNVYEQLGGSNVARAKELRGLLA